MDPSYPPPRFNRSHTVPSKDAHIPFSEKGQEDFSTIREWGYISYLSRHESDNKSCFRAPDVCDPRVDCILSLSMRDSASGKIWKELDFIYNNFDCSNDLLILDLRTKKIGKLSRKDLPKIDHDRSASSYVAYDGTGDDEVDDEFDISSGDERYCRYEAGFEPMSPRTQRRQSKKHKNHRDSRSRRADVPLPTHSGHQSQGKQRVHVETPPRAPSSRDRTKNSLPGMPGYYNIRTQAPSGAAPRPPLSRTHRPPPVFASRSTSSPSPAPYGSYKTRVQEPSWIPPSAPSPPSPPTSPDRGRRRQRPRPRAHTERPYTPPPASSNSRRLDALRILGVGEGATEREIRARYRSLALENHPDRCGKGDGERAAANERMADINRAMEDLEL